MTTDDGKSLADVLYSRPSAQPTSDPRWLSQPAPRATEQQPKPIGDLLYGNVDVALQPALRARETDRVVVLGLSDEQRATEYKAFAADLQKSGLDAHTVGRRVLDLDIDGRIRQARGDVPDDAAFAQMVQRDAEASREELANTYGVAEVNQLLARAQKFVKQYPALADMLATDGIGVRPEILVPIVKHVRRIDFY